MNQSDAFFNSIFKLDGKFPFIKYVSSVIQASNSLSQPLLFTIPYNNVKNLILKVTFGSKWPLILNTDIPKDYIPVDIADVKISQILSKDFYHTETIGKIQYTKIFIDKSAKTNYDLSAYIDNIDIADNTFIEESDKYPKKCANISVTSYDIKDILQRRLCDHYEKVKYIGAEYNRIVFTVMDLYPQTLLKYIQCMKNFMDYQIFEIILFQIVYCLTLITEKYPKFSHNDLHTENILISIYEFNLNDLNFAKYYYKDLTFRVPKVGVQAKIIDFGFSEIPELNIKSVGILSPSVQSKKTSDLIYLFQDIYHVSINDLYMRNILNKYIPEEFYSKNSLEYIKQNGKLSDYSAEAILNKFTQFKVKEN